MAEEDKVVNNKLTALWRFIERVGFPTALSIALIYLGFLQVRAVNEQADRDRTFIREVLVNKLDESTSALGSVNIAVEQSTKAMENTNQALQAVNRTHERLLMQLEHIENRQNSN